MRAPKQPEPAGPVSTSAATASLRRPAPPTITLDHPQKTAGPSRATAFA